MAAAARGGVVVARVAERGEGGVLGHAIGLHEAGFGQQLERTFEQRRCDGCRAIDDAPDAAQAVGVHNVDRRRASCGKKCTCA
jgi:hypothetical protein